MNDKLMREALGGVDEYVRGKVVVPNRGLGMHAQAFRKVTGELLCEAPIPLPNLSRKGSFLEQETV